MGFNKRYVSIERVLDAYKKDPERGIDILVGKSDAIIFQDSISHEIFEEWFNGNRSSAIKKIEDVLRIPPTTS